MRPKNYTEKNGKTTYHYTFKKLREFLDHGHKEGNNGWILVSEQDNFTKWRGFGTIEAPIHTLRTFEVENDPFSQKGSPQDYIDSFDKKEGGYTSHRMVIWDASTENKII